MNRLGIVVDVSHASDQTAWDVLEVAAGPVIASHSNARALREHPRNLPDDLLQAIAQTGGVIGVTAVPSFISDQPGTLAAWVDHLEHVRRGGRYRPRRHRRRLHRATCASSAASWRCPPGARLGAPSCPPFEGMQAPQDLPALTAELHRRGFTRGRSRAHLLPSRTTTAFSDCPGSGKASAHRALRGSERSGQFGIRADCACAFGKLGRWILDCAAGRQSSRRRARGWAEAWRARWPPRAPTWSCFRATRRRSKPPPRRSDPAATGARVVGLAADATSAADLERVVKTAVDRFGGVDVLFNNAGGPKPGHVRHALRRRLAERLRAQPDVGDSTDAAVPAVTCAPKTGAG